MATNPFGNLIPQLAPSSAPTGPGDAAITQNLEVRNLGSQQTVVVQPGAQTVNIGAEDVIQQ